MEDSLYVIWAYSQYLQKLNKNFPADIEVSREFLKEDELHSKGIYAWELELLLNEVILNAQLSPRCTLTLKRWGTLARVINNLKTLENEIAIRCVNEENGPTEISRIAHRQFPWQNLFFNGHLIRYYKIFNYAPLNEMVQDELGLTVYQVYSIGYLLSAFYMGSPAIELPIDITLKEINIDSVTKFLKLFSRELSTVRDLVKREREINEKYLYSYKSLREFPIIKMHYRGQLSIVCPIPTLLLWRFTGGLYYELVGKKGFDKFWGISFQKFVGEIIKKSHSNKDVHCLPENEYYIGRDRKDTVDWVVHDIDSALFIECKTKRLIIPAKIELTDTTFIQEELEKMAQFIVQTYKTINDYRNNYYPALKFREERQIFPVIVTLEDWYLFSVPMLEDLRGMVKNKLKDSDLPLSFLDEMPYAILPVEDFEKLMQFIQIKGIKSVLRGKTFNKEKSSFLFEDDYKTLFQQMIDSVRATG